MDYSHNPQIVAIIHRLSKTNSFLDVILKTKTNNPRTISIIHRLSKTDSFLDVVSLKVQTQMWIISIIPYNLWIMPIILPIMHHNPHNPWIISHNPQIHELLVLHQVRSLKRKTNENHTQTTYPPTHICTYTRTYVHTHMPADTRAYD